jgi:hypothetical protein
MKWLVIILILCFLIIFFYKPYSFPPTLLINLDHRTDRLNEIRNEFRNWPTPVERVPAVRLTPGWKGCSASHLNCIRLAKQRGYPWVLVLEDDCMLTPEATRRFQEMLPVLWDTRSQWDIFYGGTTFLKDYSHKIKTLYEVKGFTTHFCLVHKNTYNLILEKYPKKEGPIDVFYSDHLRIWTAAPFLAIQRPSKSDIGKDADYKDLFKEAEKKLLQN